VEAHSLEEIAALVVLDIAVIVAVARLMGRLCRRIGQPAVVGEIFAGVALGPSLLGALPGDLTSVLFPEDVRPFLSVIAGLGLVIYMFVVGLELNLDLIRGKGRLAATISICSVVTPLLLGIGLALWLYDAHNSNAAGEQIELLPFALFIGASMSVTAFPVLARILAEQRMNRTQTGALALACAAIDDVLAWIILAVVLAVIRSSGGLDLVVMSLQSAAFVLVMFFLVAPALRRLVDLRDRAGQLTPDLFAIVLVGALVSSYVTSQIGIHAIFGAFVFGAAMPRRGAEQMSQEILERVEPLTVLLLLPVFFVSTGLNVDITALGSTGFAELAAVLAVAVAGKFLGATAAARASGVHIRRAGAIGILMNTRGLTELVILNVGYAVGVLDQQLFTVLVLMALVTTVMTAPLLRLLYGPERVDREIAQTERRALGLTAGYRAVVIIDEGTTPEAVSDAATLIGEETSAEMLLLRLDPQQQSLELGAGLGAELELVAATYERMEELASEPRSRGIRVVTRSQFSNDVGEDALRLADAARADVLVWAREDGAVPAAVLAGAEWPVVWLVRSDDAMGDVAADGTVVVEPGRDDDGLAAVEQAVRATLQNGLTLALRPGPDRRDRRRCQGLLEKLTAAGVDAWTLTQEHVPESQPPALHVVGWNDLGQDGSGPVRARTTLVVRGAPEDHGQRLDSLLSLLRSRVEA
jgi:Kef-type K+ transport system membrane component KefB